MPWRQHLALFSSVATTTAQLTCILRSLDQVLNGVRQARGTERRSKRGPVISSADCGVTMIFARCLIMSTRQYDTIIIANAMRRAIHALTS